MKKISSLFQRNYETDRLVRDEIVPGSEWVQQGEGVATRKFDGTCCMFRGGRLYKRYTVHSGKPTPEHFEPATDVDPMTGKQEGWLPVTKDAPEDQYYREALKPLLTPPADGTYELCGPKVQGNPERFEKHTFVPHGKSELAGVPRDFNGIRRYLEMNPGLEGIVWHHADGRMVKIKAKDFGLHRK